MIASLSMYIVYLQTDHNKRLLLIFMKDEKAYFFLDSDNKWQDFESTVFIGLTQGPYSKLFFLLIFKTYFLGN